MTTEFLIDGMLSGTGLRDAVHGGYLRPQNIGLSESLAQSISEWHQRYEQAHFDGFPEDIVAELDVEGMALALDVERELSGRTVGYFSNGRMKRLS